MITNVVISFATMFVLHKRNYAQAVKNQANNTHRYQSDLMARIANPLIRRFESYPMLQLQTKVYNNLSVDRELDFCYNRDLVS